MSYIDVDICNLALYRVGQRQPISALDDGSLGAQLCSLMYPIARDGLLTKAQWRFATVQA